MFAASNENVASATNLAIGESSHTDFRQSFRQTLLGLGGHELLAPGGYELLAPGGHELLGIEGGSPEGPPGHRRPALVPHMGTKTGQSPAEDTLPRCRRARLAPGPSHNTSE
jgi:hypothetical protein